MKEKKTDDNDVNGQRKKHDDSNDDDNEGNDNSKANLIGTDERDKDIIEIFEMLVMLESLMIERNACILIELEKLTFYGYSSKFVKYMKVIVK
jgi:hypothetical protein